MVKNYCVMRRSEVMGLRRNLGMMRILEGFLVNMIRTIIMMEHFGDYDS